MRTLLVTDNHELLYRFKNLVDNLPFITDEKYSFKYAYSFNNKSFADKYNDSCNIFPLNIKEEVDTLIVQFDLIISLHCKQLFPKKLVESIRCINIHPGLNPFNRGWYPQVFSIINGLPSGATIHEIDEFLDHGSIICQKEVKIEVWDTSLTAYDKILNAEIELLNSHLEKILTNTYKPVSPEFEGNVNLKKDFNSLCQIELKSVDTFENHINHLRALTHGNYTNAYFYDSEGNKISVKIELNKCDE